MRFFENANFDFVGRRHLGYFISGTLIIISLLVLLFKGLQYGIDFRGGTELVVSFHKPLSVADARLALGSVSVTEPQIRYFGSGNQLQIRTTDIDADRLGSQVQLAFANHFPGNPSEIIKTDQVGPVFATDMQEAAILATVFSLIVISMYIFLRFRDLSFALSVLLTLLHDVIIILGFFTLLHGILPFNMDIDQTLIGAFLTIIGYSLNDTIVVFDRIRENRRIYKIEYWMNSVNKSINQTLSRTVVTSLTTLMVVVVLFLFGGEVLRGFSFALMAGIVLGTYSTIFVACPLLIDMRRQQIPNITSPAIMPRKTA